MCIFQGIPIKHFCSYAKHTIVHNQVLAIMLTLEFGMVSHIELNSSLSFKHVSFWCPFLDLHLTIHHSNIDVQILEHKDVYRIHSCSKLMEGEMYFSIMHIIIIN